MNKKKVQEFIKKLKTATASSFDFDAVKKTEMLETMDLDETKAIATVSDGGGITEAKYISISCTDGGEGHTTVSNAHSLIVELDLAAWASDNGFSSYHQIGRLDLTVAGMNRMGHGELSFYKYDTHEFISNSISGQNIFTCSFVPTIDSQGKTRILLFGGENWSGTQSFPATFMKFSCVKQGLKELQVLVPPSKMRYKEGEIFSDEGLVLAAIYADGNKEVLNVNNNESWAQAAVKINPTFYPDRNLEGADRELRINYAAKQLRLPIYVDSESESEEEWLPFNFTLKLQKRTRKSIDASWSDWSEATSLDGYPSNAIVATGLLTDNTQFRTILTLTKSLSAGFEKEIKICLKKYEGYNTNKYKGHIIINGQRQYIYGDLGFAVLRAGTKSSIINNDMQIIFEPGGDMNFVFEASSNVTPTRIFCDYKAFDDKSEIKTFQLTSGIKANLDLLSREVSIEIPEISSESSLLGIGLTHIFRFVSDDYGMGYRFKLNLHQQLHRITEFSGKVHYYEYTDAYGNKKTYYNYFYYLDEDNKKQYYVVTDLTDRITLGTDGELHDAEYEDNRVVYYSEKRAHWEVYDNLVPGSCSRIQYFIDICSDSSKEIMKPVIYLVSNTVVKGFNSFGDLVWINDQYGNFISIEYNQNNRICRIRNQNAKTLEFSYENDVLKSITDGRGRVIEYTYTLGTSLVPRRLTKISVKKSNNSASYRDIQIEYQAIGGIANLFSDYIISSIESSDNIRCTLSYDEYGQLREIKKYSTVNKIPNGAELSEIGDGELLEKYLIDCSTQPYQTTVSDIVGNQEIFRFDENRVRSEYYQVINGKVSTAEKYSKTYLDNGNKKVGNIKARRSSLNQFDFNNYIFRDGDTIETTYDIYERPILKEVSEVNIPKTLSTTYIYNSVQQCIKEKTTEEYSNGTTFTYVIEKQYNDKGSLNKTFEYVKGEESTTGIMATEYIYNEQGNITKEMQYKKVCNVNNPSSCDCDFDCLCVATIFCKEKTYNQNGLLQSEKDETGLYSTNYTYIDNTNLISNINNPNGNSIGYAYDSEDNVTSVFNTIEGVENANEITYLEGEITEFNHSGNDNYLDFEYEKKRRLSLIKFGGLTYETITYEDGIDLNSNVDKVSLKNAKGEIFQAVINRDGSYEKAYYQSSENSAQSLLLEKEYDEYGQLSGLIDHLSGEEVSIVYDNSGNIKTYVSKTNNVSYNETYTYSARGQLVSVNYSGRIARVNQFTYNSDSIGECNQIRSGDFYVLPTYDLFRRLESLTIKNTNGTILDTTTIAYRKEGKNATHFVNQLTYKDQSYLSYIYDNMGNIQQIKRDNHLLAQYQYDGLNRLIREDNVAFNETYLYTYDNNGNIKTKETHVYTNGTLTSGTGEITSYLYNAQGQVISYNGESCVYDAVGNPTTYRGKTLTWVRGRRLSNYNGTTFTYDAQGKRIGKNNTQYYYNSAEKPIASSDGLEYFYGIDGVIGCTYNGIQYAYRKNLQGDVIALVDSSGVVVVEYIYDAWGNHVVVDASGNEITSATHIGNLNPFRYRGYFYDVETGLYYLKSRYYDPETGRFINMDSIEYANPEEINGLNLYAYCGNNPVMRIDENGNAWWHWIIGAAIIVACAALTVVTAGGVAAAGAALASVFTATMAPTALSAVFAGATIGATTIGVAGMIIGGMSGEDEWSWENASQGFMAGSMVGAVIGSAWGGTHYALQSAGKMAIRTNINNLVNNPLDEFVTIGPKDGGISNYVRLISQSRDYGQIFASKLSNGMYQIANGHHRVAALRQLGYKYVKFFLVL